MAAFPTFSASSFSGYPSYADDPTNVAQQLPTRAVMASALIAEREQATGRERSMSDFVVQLLKNTHPEKIDSVERLDRLALPTWDLVLAPARSGGTYPAHLIVQCDATAREITGLLVQDANREQLYQMGDISLSKVGQEAPHGQDTRRGLLEQRLREQQAKQNRTGAAVPEQSGAKRVRPTDEVNVIEPGIKRRETEQSRSTVASSSQVGSSTLDDRLHHLNLTSPRPDSPVSDTSVESLSSDSERSHGSAVSVVRMQNRQRLIQGKNTLHQTSPTSIIVPYQWLRPKMHIQNLIASLPRRDRTAYGLYKSLHPQPSSREAAILNGLRNFDALNQHNICALCENFSTFAKIEYSLCFDNPDEAGTRGRSFLAALRSEVFPQSPAAMTALADIARNPPAEWAKLVASQVKLYTNIWELIDVWHAHHDKRLLRMLEGDEAAEIFIETMHEFQELNYAPNMVKGAIRMWRAARYPLEAEQLIRDQLNDAACVRMATAIGSCAEFGFMQGVPPTEFLMALARARDTDLETYLINFSGAPKHMQEILDTLRDRYSLTGNDSNADTAQKIALRAIMEKFGDRWDDFDEKTQARYLNQIRDFGTFVKSKDYDLNQLQNDPEPARQLVLMKHLYTEHHDVQPSALRMWRAAAFEQRLDIQLREKIEAFPLNTQHALRDFLPIAHELVEFQLARRLEPDAFLEKLTNLSEGKEMEELGIWCGSPVLIRRFIAHLDKLHTASLLESPSDNPNNSSPESAVHALRNTDLKLDRFLLVWKDFDRFLERNGTSLQLLLEKRDGQDEPQRAFIMAHQQYVAEKHYSYARPALEIWRRALFPLPVEGVLRDVADTMDKDSNSRRLIELTAGALAEYAVTRQLDDDTMIAHLNGNSGDMAALKADIRAVTGVHDTQITAVLAHLRGKLLESDPATEEKHLESQIIAFMGDEWQQTKPSTQLRLQKVWDSFDDYLRKNNAEGLLPANDDAARKAFIALKRAFIGQMKDKRNVEMRAISLLRQALCPLPAEDRLKKALASIPPVNPKTMTTFYNIVPLLAEYAAEKGLKEQQFERDLISAIKTKNEKLIQSLISHSGSATDILTFFLKHFGKLGDTD